MHARNDTNWNTCVCASEVPIVYDFIEHQLLIFAIIYLVLFLINVKLLPLAEMINLHRPLGNV